MAASSLAIPPPISIRPRTSVLCFTLTMSNFCVSQSSTRIGLTAMETRHLMKKVRFQHRMDECPLLRWHGVHVAVTCSAWTPSGSGHSSECTSVNGGDDVSIERAYVAESKGEPGKWEDFGVSVCHPWSCLWRAVDGLSIFAHGL